MIYRRLRKYQSEIENAPAEEPGVPPIVAAAAKRILGELKRLARLRYLEEAEVETIKSLVGRWRNSEKGQRAMQKAMLFFKRGRRIDDAYNVLIFLLISYVRQRNHNKPYYKDVLFFLDEWELNAQSYDDDTAQTLKRRYLRLESNLSVVRERFEIYREISFLGFIDNYYEYVPHNHQYDASAYSQKNVVRFNLPAWDSIAFIKKEPRYHDNVDYKNQTDFIENHFARLSKQQSPS